MDNSEILTRHSTNFTRLKRRLVREIGHAIEDYRMIEQGDVVLVCVSGGKDSFTMLDLLLHMQKRAPVKFDLIAMNLDQGQPGFPAQVLPDYFNKIGVPYHIEREDTYAVVQEKIPQGKTTCSLCSRLRRAIIYRVAKQLGANKVALGHHREDIVETFFLNLFFAAKLKAMPPKLISDDQHHVLIRPLAYCAEKDLARYARGMQFPIIPCNLCGLQENLQRKTIKAMLQTWETEYPGRVNNIFHALQNVSRSHLADTSLYDFAGLNALPLPIMEIVRAVGGE